MAWVAVGMAVVSVAGSVAGSVASNKQASAQYEQQVDAIKKSLTKQYGQLQEQARAENENVALEMATARFEGLKATATTSNVITERNLTGNTAARAFNQSLVNKTMAHNALAKKAQDAMISYGSNMEAKRDEAINSIYGANAQLSANTKNTAQVVTGAVSAGASGYAMGSALGGVFSGSSVSATGSNTLINSQTLTAQSVLPSGGGAFVNPNSLTSTSFYSGGFK